MAPSVRPPPRPRWRSKPHPPLYTAPCPRAGPPAQRSPPQLPSKRSPSGRRSQRLARMRLRPRPPRPAVPKVRLPGRQGGVGCSCLCACAAPVCQLPFLLLLLFCSHRGAILVGMPITACGMWPLLHAGALVTGTQLSSAAARTSRGHHLNQLYVAFGAQAHHGSRRLRRRRPRTTHWRCCATLRAPTSARPPAPLPILW